jgi:hypothetical protein
MVNTTEVAEEPAASFLSADLEDEGRKLSKRQLLVTSTQLKY